MTAPRCQIQIPRNNAPTIRCNGLAVSVWKSGHGEIPVCEQCESLVQDCAKGGTMTAVFEELPF